jgi:hypothetical protein
MRTRGKVGYAYCAEKGTDIISANAGSKIIAHCADGDDGYFIASVFNTAHALDEAGYDGEKAIRELPELVKVLDDMLSTRRKADSEAGLVAEHEARAALDKIRGEHDRS